MKKPVQFGKYLLLDRINVGGMAEVFKAKAFGVEGFERLVAVKRILPNIAEDEEFITMFIDEAKIAVQLNHANICQIFDLGKADDAFFIALEFVQGKDLRAMYDLCKSKPGINEGSPAMPIGQACFIMMKACEGLDYAHNKKDQNGQEIHLVHRDVSPQNILISYEGEVKLIDFGIAKAAGKVSKTQQGILKGKFGYMSPEQVRGLPLDRRSDIFSLGICLYEMLTAERLFIGESDFSTLEKVRNVEILPPSTYNRRIPEELERICLKALAKDVEDRYQNAIDMHDDLQAFMYTAGEFFSRKDLGGWMKRVYDDDIRAEQAKLESYQRLPAIMQPSPETPVATSRRTGAMAAVSSAPPPVPPRASGQHAAIPATEMPTNEVRRVDPQPGPPRVEAKTPAGNNGHVNGAPKPARNGQHAADLNWDDEELATNIYDDKPEAAPISETSRPDLSKVELSADGAPVPSRPTPARGIRIDASRTAPEAARPLAQHRPPRARKGPSTTMMAAGIGAVALLFAFGIGSFLWLAGRPGSIHITTEPPGAQILIDNARIAEDTPSTIEEKPGSYAVTVQRDGYVPHSEQVDVRSREAVRRNFVLEPLTSGTGFKLSEPIGAQVFLDGKQLDGQTPLQVQSVMPGKHKIEVRGAYGSWSEDVTLEAGKMADLHPVFPSSPSNLAPVPPTPTHVDPLEPPTPHHVALEEGTPHERPTPKVLTRRHVTPASDEADPVTPSRPPVERPTAGGEGYLRINSKPWTNITIDGKDSGLHTPQTQLKLPAGSHRVQLANPQFGVRETFSVEIHAGATETVVKDFRPKDTQQSDD
ncbi:MAG: serine/threonine-protein kinase [Polyangia bacterium]